MRWHLKEDSPGPGRCADCAMRSDAVLARRAQAGLVPTAQWNGEAMKKLPSALAAAAAACHSAVSSAVRPARIWDSKPESRAGSMPGVTATNWGKKVRLLRPAALKRR